MMMLQALIQAFNNFWMLWNSIFAERETEFLIDEVLFTARMFVNKTNVIRPRKIEEW